MYTLFASAIGEEIVNKMKIRGLYINHINSCYSVIGIKKNELFDYIDMLDDSINVAINIEYYYLTNLEVDKYLTKKNTGKFKINEYNFINCMPVCARPSIFLIGNNEYTNFELEKQLISEYENGKNIEIKHPNFADEMISLKLRINPNVNIEHTLIDEHKYITIINCDTVNIPWFINEWQRNDFMYSKKFEFLAMEQLVALIEIITNYDNRIKEYGTSSENGILLQRRVNEINLYKLNLLDVLNISKELRTDTMVQKIMHLMRLKRYSVEDAISSIKSEELKKKEKEEEIARKQREIELRKRQREQEYYSVDEVYDDYYDRPRRESIIGSIVKPVSEERNTRKKNIRDRQDYFGTANCVMANGTGVHCMQCPLFWKCTQEWA